MTIHSIDSQHAGNVWDVAKTDRGQIHIYDSRHESMRKINRFGVFARIYESAIDEQWFTASQCEELAKSLMEVASAIREIEKTEPQYHSKLIS